MPLFNQPPFSPSAPAPAAAPLIWDSWNRSEFQRKHMDETVLAGVGFATIFLETMRKFFLDENRNVSPISVYSGAINNKVTEILDTKRGGRRFQFTISDQERMLKAGLFHFTPSRSLTIQHMGDRFIARRNGLFAIEINQDNIVRLAKEFNGGAEDGSAVEIARHITGAGILWAIMLQHGFAEGAFDLRPESDFNHSLPTLAYDAVMALCPVAIASERHSSHLTGLVVSHNFLDGPGVIRD